MVLYHTLIDSESAEVRQLIVQLNLTERIQFRNIDRSESAAQDLQKLTGNLKVPVLVMPQKIFSGKLEIFNYLQGPEFK